MKLKFKDYLNAAIIVTWLINIIVINVFIIKCVDSSSISSFLICDAGPFKTWCYICIGALSILYIIKLVLSLTKEEAK